MRILSLLSVIGAIIFISSVMLSTMSNAVGTTVNNLPKKGEVSVSGIVEKVEDDRRFILRDSTGTIDIAVENEALAIPKQGDNVIVTGMIEKRAWGLLGKEIKASSIQMARAATPNPSQPGDLNPAAGSSSPRPLLGPSPAGN